MGRIGLLIFGLLLLVAVVAVVLRFSELEQFIALLGSARPEWLALALVVQGATYVSAAAVWHRILAREGFRQSLRSLVPLGVAKLFVDQALPSGGLSGVALIIAAFGKRGIPVQAATGTLVASIVSFYGAYLILVLVSVGILWRFHEMDSALLGIVTAFAAVAVLIPSVVLVIATSNRDLPKWFGKFPTVAGFLTSITHCGTDILKNPRLMGEAVLLQATVFLLDALTLWCVFQALGQEAGFLTAFNGYMMGSVAATVAPIPLGLGTFEAGSVGMLHFMGMSLEAALAATLMLRGLTFWLPMIPGIWLARRELEKHGPVLKRG